MGNFGLPKDVQATHNREINERTMKKVLLIVVAVLVSSAVLTSCGSHGSCPAYGKVAKVPAEHRC
jgi:hypothetical protein